MDACEKEFEELEKRLKTLLKAFEGAQGEIGALKEALSAKEALIEELQGRLKKAGKERGAAKEKIDVLLTRLDNLT